MQPVFSIAICTYNRGDILAHCLESIPAADQIPYDLWELVLIDNNSKDSTNTIYKKFAQEHASINTKYFLETKQGLSHARNRACRESSAPWIMYLDDDAKVERDFLKICLKWANSGEHKIIGGVYLPWYHYGRPDWFKDEYASNKLKGIEQFSKGIKGYYVSGGVMMWEKALIDKLGGFDPKVGMNGEKVAYGEETFLQKEANKSGIEAAYDPNLIIYHLVPKYKLKPSFFIKKRYAIGRDMVIGGQLQSSNLYMLAQIIYGLIFFIFKMSANGLKLLFSSKYYIENWFIDSLRDASMRAGIVYTALVNEDQNS